MVYKKLSYFLVYLTATALIRCWYNIITINYRVFIAKVIFGPVSVYFIGLWGSSMVLFNRSRRSNGRSV